MRVRTFVTYEVGNLAERVLLQVLGRLVLLGCEVDGDDLDFHAELLCDDEDALRASRHGRSVNFDHHYDSNGAVNEKEREAIEVLGQVLMMWVVTFIALVCDRIYSKTEVASASSFAERS